MTDQLRTLLDHAADTPLRAFDTDGVVRRGRSRVRRRRFCLAGGAVFGAATVTVAALSITTTLMIGATGAPPISAGQPNPIFTLPPLDPSKSYHWSSNGRADNDVSARLTASLVDYVGQHFPQAMIQVGTGGQGDGVTYEDRLVPPGAPDSTFRVSHYTNSLYAPSEQTSTGTSDGTTKNVYPHDRPPATYQEPVYRLWTNGPPGAEYDAGFTLHQLSGAQVVFDGVGHKQTDFLRFVVFPNGGYRIGFDPATLGAGHASNGYLVEGCATYTVTNAHPGTDDDRRFSFECSETAGPNGERIYSVSAHETYLSVNRTFTINTVAVTRRDGTAVVVGDTPRPALNWKQGNATGVGTNPTLSVADLAGIALSVPLVPVA